MQSFAYVFLDGHQLVRNFHRLNNNKFIIIKSMGISFDGLH